MSVERKQIQHYHTTNSEAIPAASDLLNGEIALNINKGNEKIFIKNNEGGISSFRGEQYYEENFLHKNDTAQSAIDLTGRIEATPEEFKYRPSAGEKSIRDESATIKRIKGNSLVYNQIYPPQWVRTYNGITTTSDDGLFTANGVHVGTFATLNVVGFRAKTLGHKYLITCELYNDNGLQNLKLGLLNQNVRKSFVNKFAYIFFDVTQSNVDKGNALGIFLPETGLTVTDFTGRVHDHDLTQMFGSGNEPTTIEEFYARIPEGVDINAYNEGELINFTAESIKTTGLNQWDEQWEIGRVDINTGFPTEDFTAAIRSKNYIRILPNKEYYLKGISNNTNIILFYDAEYNYISNLATTNVLNKTFITPANAKYIKFYVGNAETPITYYNNDICINLSHTGVRDGEYEPYKEFTHDLSWIKKYFPNGMRSAGSAYDEITETEAIQRIGEVDLGSLEWSIRTTSETGKYSWGANLSTPSVGTDKIANIICAKYITKNANDIYLLKDKTIAVLSNVLGISVNIYDSTYTSEADKDSFVESLQGVKLYYELAEPVVTPIEEIVNFSYEVGDFGTEEIISNGPTTPFKGDIVYQFNAVDRIRDNSRDIEKLKNSLNKGAKPYIIDVFEFANELGNLSSDDSDGFSANGIITQERYDEIIKAVENKNLIFSVSNTNWNYATCKTPYQNTILISSRIEPAIPGNGGIFLDVMMFIDEETLECSISLDDGGDISSLLQGNLKTVNGESLVGSGNINIAGGSSLVSILYDELVNLRDNNGLIPGTWYRITDYNTTVGSGEYLINTSVAGHQFDVLVLATSENTLSEEAKAIKHDGDEYFSTSNLDAWKIWYSLDNNTNRFEWADTTNGKGVIYRMIDEYGNDCPYDFKNMLFEVYKITATTEYTSSLMGKYAIMNLLDPETETNLFELDTENPRASYTFCMFDEYDGLAHDVSVEQTKYGWGATCNESLQLLDDEIISLTPNIFVTDTTMFNSSFGGYMFNNFKGMSGLNIFNSETCGNVFDSVQLCVFGSGCSFNKATYTFMNVMGDDFVGNNLSQITFNSVFDSNCGANNFGQYFMNNKIGTGCLYNNFGAFCYNSIFDNDFVSNNVGAYCFYTTIVGDGENVGNPIMNYRIGSGIGVFDGGETRTTIHLNRGVGHEMKVAKNSSGEIKIYCEADLIS